MILYLEKKLAAFQKHLGDRFMFPFPSGFGCDPAMTQCTEEEENETQIFSSVSIPAEQQ